MAVTILPVSHESSLYQLLPHRPAFPLYDREEGEHAVQTLGRSILYTDPVVSTVRMLPRSLYSLGIAPPANTAYTVNGFIAAAPAAN